MFGELIPIVAIVAILATAWVIVPAMNYGRGRRGRRGLKNCADENEVAENASLSRENADLKRTVGRLEDRLAVLERIATDPAERTAREIESLRHD